VGVFSIACGLHLLLGSLSECDTEQSKDESIGGLGLNISLDEGVPFLDHGACLISGNIHSVEVCVAIESLNLINLEFKLSPGLGLGLVVAVSEGDVENTTFQTLRCLLLSCRLVARGECNGSLIKSWGKDVVPLFLHEWMCAIEVSG